MTDLPPCPPEMFRATITVDIDREPNCVGVRQMHVPSGRFFRSTTRKELEALGIEIPKPEFLGPEVCGVRMTEAETRAWSYRNRNDFDWTAWEDALIRECQRVVAAYDGTEVSE